MNSDEAPASERHRRRGLAPLALAREDAAPRELHVVHRLRVMAKFMRHLGDEAGAAAMLEAARVVALELVPLDLNLADRGPRV